MSGDAPEKPTIEDIDHVFTCDACTEMRANEASKVLQLCRDDPEYRARFFGERPVKAPAIPS